MKRCPKCGTEFNDSDRFCSKCGIKLETENVCQKCGSPVSVDDVFCKHCGHKIEKEFKCGSCGEVIAENAKYCSRCGAKIENPIIAIAKRKGANKDGVVQANNSLAGRIVSFALGGVLLTLLILMLVGCFGDIAVIKSSETVIGRALEGYNVSIKYFFGDAVKQINEARKSMRYPEYPDFLTAMLVIEYIFWIAAIITFITGIVIISIKLCKAVKAKEEFAVKKYFISFIMAGLPYLLLMYIQYAFRADVISSNLFSSDSSLSASRSSNIEITYGWGTQMILVTTFIGAAALPLYKIGSSIIMRDKGEIIRNSILSILGISLLIVLVCSFGQVINFHYSETGYSLKGYITSYPLFENALKNYSSDTTQEMPIYAFKAIISVGLLFVGGLVGVALIDTMIGSPKFVVAIIILTLLSIAILIPGYVIGYLAYIESSGNYMSLVTIEKEYVDYATMGVLLPIFTLLFATGQIVVSNLKIGNQANA